MKIMVSNIEDCGEVEVSEGTCDHCFEWGYYNQYLATFSLMMSDGTSYEIRHDGIVDYEENRNGLVESYTYTKPISNILKFVSDLKTVQFPDIQFFEDYDKFIASRRPGNMVITEYIGRQKDQGDRKKAIIEVIDRFIMEVIRAYADNGVDGINKYIDKETAFARKDD